MTTPTVQCSRCGRTNFANTRVAGGAGAWMACWFCGAALSAGAGAVPNPSYQFFETCPRCDKRIEDRTRACWLRGPKGYMQPYHLVCAQAEINEEEEVAGGPAK